MVAASERVMPMNRPSPPGHLCPSPPFPPHPVRSPISPAIPPETTPIAKSLLLSSPTLPLDPSPPHPDSFFGPPVSRATVLYALRRPPSSDALRPVRSWPLLPMLRLRAIRPLLFPRTCHTPGGGPECAATPARLSVPLTSPPFQPPLGTPYPTAPPLVSSSAAAPDGT